MDVHVMQLKISCLLKKDDLSFVSCYNKIQTSKSVPLYIKRKPNRNQEMITKMIQQQMSSIMTP